MQSSSTCKVKVAQERGPSESCWPVWPITEKRKVTEIPKLVERLPSAQATDNNAIIDSPCVSQFYLLKLVTGNQRATGMKFAVRVNGRMRSIKLMNE